MGLPFWGGLYFKNPHQVNQQGARKQCTEPPHHWSTMCSTMHAGSPRCHANSKEAAHHGTTLFFLPPSNLPCKNSCHLLFVVLHCTIPAHLWCQTPPSLTTRSSAFWIPTPMEIQVLSAFSSPIQIAHASFLSPYLIYSATTQFAFGYECWQGRHCCREVPK